MFMLFFHKIHQGMSSKAYLPFQLEAYRYVPGEASLSDTLGFCQSFHYTTNPNYRNP